MRMIADKRLTYAGRVLRPGVGFDAKPAAARVLVATGRARFAPADPPGPCIVPDAEIGSLRTEYETRTGKAPDMRWGVKRLEKEIAALW